MNRWLKLKACSWSQFSYGFLSLIILFIVVWICLEGSGVDYTLRGLLAMVFLVLILNMSRITYWYILFPVVCLIVVYIPIGLTYGLPTYQYMASILTTSFTESKELLISLPAYNYLLALAALFGFVIFRYLNNRHQIQWHQNKVFLCIGVLFLSFNEDIVKYFYAWHGAYQSVQAELKTMNEAKADPKWGESIVETSKAYDNYVLIIGESARKDYHHAFGYGVNNTPFMSTQKGILVDGLTAAGANTIASLRLMLTKGDTVQWKPNYQYNIIDLAKLAGIQTYWLSNQGKMGEFDTPVTIVANQSDETYFLKAGAYDSLNTSDERLLPKIKQVLGQQPKKRKLIVVHLYGSHSDFCERVQGYSEQFVSNDSKFRDLSCYVTSIHKTDRILKEIHGYLSQSFAENNATFSMLYFSDHGLSHEAGNSIYLRHIENSQYSYDIPLFMTASDSHEKKYCKAHKSGLNFTVGLANWMAIKNKNIDPNYQLFDCQNDSTDYGLSHRFDPKFDKIDQAVDILNH